MIFFAIVASLLTLPYRTAELPGAVGLVSASGSITAFADFFTAALLLGQAYINRSRSAAWFAAYSLCFLIVIPPSAVLPRHFHANAAAGPPGDDGLAIVHLAFRLSDFRCRLRRGAGRCSGAVLLILAPQASGPSTD
jgi:hypothetical protein